MTTDTLPPPAPTVAPIGKGRRGGTVVSRTLRYLALTLFLLIAIGLKGGVALSEHANPALAPQALAIDMLGLVLPIIAFPLLSHIGQLSRDDVARQLASAVGSWRVIMPSAAASPVSWSCAFAPTLPIWGNVNVMICPA